MNEVGGAGAVRYVDVRDHFSVREYRAWWAWISAWNEQAAEREKDKRHDDVMSKAFKALNP